MSFRGAEVPPDLSITLDMETAEISGKIVLDTRLALWLEAARSIAPKTFEIIICTKAEVSSRPDLPPEIRSIVAKNQTYYGLKNEAARAARGEIVSFCDIDCRPGADYFRNLLRHFEDPSVNILGGRSYYDGEQFMTRVNTATAFGYLHGSNNLRGEETYLGHNVSIRRRAVPLPFGPYTNRYGGDEHLTHRLRQEGDPLPVFQDLVMYHESPAFNLRTLVERHLSEVVRNCFMRSGTAMTSAEVLREARRMSGVRWTIFKRQAGKFGFTRWEKFKARQLYRFYGLFDTFSAFLLYLKPLLYARWLRHQYGDFANARPVDHTAEVLAVKMAG